jgi:hypothetical protein
MATKRSSIASISTLSSITSTTSTTSPTNPSRRSSTTTTPHYDHKITLIPHTSSPTYFDIPLTRTESDLISSTEARFDDRDLSSQDFDFDDVFTFDRPLGRKVRSGVVEVSTPSREIRPSNPSRGVRHVERDWAAFSFSHYGGGAGQGGNVSRQARQRQRPGVAGMQRELGWSGIGAAYVRNQQARR